MRHHATSSHSHPQNPEARFEFQSRPLAVLGGLARQAHANRLEAVEVKNYLRHEVHPVGRQPEKGIFRVISHERGASSR